MRLRRFPLGRFGLIIAVIFVLVLAWNCPYFRLQKLIFPSQTVGKRIWILELQENYRQCGHSELKQQRYHSVNSFQRANTAYNRNRLIATGKYSSRYLVAYSGLCYSCRHNQFLGIKEQRVVVIRGTPVAPGPILEFTPLKINNLPSAELIDLAKGIPFKDSRDKLQLLEGLSGLITN